MELRVHGKAFFPPVLEMYLTSKKRQNIIQPEQGTEPYIPAEANALGG